MAIEFSDLQDLIVVAGHAVRKTRKVVNPESDREWYLLDYQKGEPPFYIEHIRRGIVFATHNQRALLIFSGGKTRPKVNRSEAESYLHVAEHYRWWLGHLRAAKRRELDIPGRTVPEERARDSFENLLFGICKFQQVAGKYPHTITVVSWAFKQARFDWHRQVIRFPSNRFRFEPFNDPIDITGAKNGEARAFSDWAASWYGETGRLKKLRKARTDPDWVNPYTTCPDLTDFFNFIRKPENERVPYPNRLPWEN